MSPKTSQETRGRARRVGRSIAIALLLVLALFLMVRGVVEVVTVDPAEPETYRADWGGPHYLGVLFVHAGPGLAVVVLAVLAVLRTRRRRPARSHADAQQH